MNVSIIHSVLLLSTLRTGELLEPVNLNNPTESKQNLVVPKTSSTNQVKMHCNINKVYIVMIVMFAMYLTPSKLQFYDAVVMIP